MKIIILGLTLMISISTFAASEQSNFERGFYEGKKAAKGRVILVEGAGSKERTRTELLNYCPEDKIEQLNCMGIVASSYVCVALCTDQ